MFRAMQPLLLKETGGALKFRLIGVGLSGLTATKWDARDLVDEGIEKRANAERASDSARQRFGTDAVTTGRGIRAKARRET